MYNKTSRLLPRQEEGPYLGTEGRLYGPPLARTGLKRWYNFMHSTFGRPLKMPSGSGAEALTDRQNFELNTFKRLRNFMRGKTDKGQHRGSSLSKSLVKPSQQEEILEEDDEEAELLVTVTPCLSMRPHPPVGSCQLSQRH